jgi:hypothetical protein
MNCFCKRIRRLLSGRRKAKNCQSASLQLEQLGERILPSAISFYLTNPCFPTDPCVHATATCQNPGTPCIPTNPCFPTNPC